MIDLVDRLRWWLAGTQSRALARAAEAYWGRAEDWLDEAVAQVDIATCSNEALRAHARDRTIARLPGEAEALWRDRVRHAVTVAREAGSRAGLEYILQVYGVSNFAVRERVAGLDWDIVLVELDSTTLSADSDVLQRVFAEWGRVCRRYAPAHRVTVPSWWHPAVVQEAQYVGVAS